ncbi:tetratricopeptide repeat protein [Pseudanabaena sp. BC1403]|uniref:tetratricopeptide repeat protein n=1 Tax=Pseudanabaena sp. BC1403 TaxID=2043171 RepID=UPI000CD8178B|nr:tetratricopeptide repeat protein [Pseudanabaena sp. BC1403]
MSYKATNWDEFIAEIAKSKISSPRLYRTFTLVFSEIGRSKTLEECSEKLLEQPVKTIGEHLREIYKLFDSDYPDLKNQGKGKRQALTECLLKLYETQKVSDNISDRPQPSTNPQNIPTPESIPELTTLEFIGRDRDLINLANLIRQAKIVLVKAGAGVGKSTLAREFLQTQFKKVIRIEMGLESGNVTPAEEKVSQILRKDFDEEPSRDFGINLDILREKLADRANPIGVLIDNLEPALDENYRFREKLRGYDALLAVLGDRDACSFTLITSRRSLIAQRVKVHEYLLEGLDITAWRQYFHDCENGVDSEALLQMRDAYNGNAKVMDILHGAIKNRFDGNIGAYWSRYKDALLADSELETLISVEMDLLRDNQPDAYKLICRMGCYRYQDVKTVPFEGVICLLWDVNESQRIGVIDYLSKTSLIEVKGGYYLHYAVREAAKLRLRENRTDWETANHASANFWTNNVQTVETIEDAFKAFEPYYHYVSINRYEDAAFTIIKKRANKWDSQELLGMSFYRLGLFQQMITAINQIIDNIHREDYLSEIYSILGSLYWMTGYINKSIESNLNSGELAVKLGNKTLEFHVLFNMGLCKLDLWEPQKALDFLLKADAIATANKFTSNEANSDGGRYAYLAFLSSVLGLREQALDFIKKSPTNVYFNQQGIGSVWSNIYSSILLGLTFKRLGMTQEALESYYKAISYADETNYTQARAKALTGIAEIYRIQQNFDIAIVCHIGSIEILNKLRAKCDLAEAYFQLGLTYQAMGEHDQAEEYKAKALQLFAQMEAPKQIERVNQAFGGNIQ